MSEYELSDEHMRGIVTASARGSDNPKVAEFFKEERGKHFDAWLAEHDRQVAERAWDEGRDQSPFFPTENPYRKVE